jgi:L-alanine-DL-glutamate epimerase-like enolase superfamily enzyme
MKISSGKYHGWSEIGGSRNNPDFDLADWSPFLKALKDKTLEEALFWLHSYQVNDSGLAVSKQEFIEIALLDIVGRVQDKPAMEILGLTGREPVPGLFCILDKDLENVRKNAEASVEHNLSSFMKIKMYGDLELDKKVLKTVREVIGEDAYVLSDVNQGYKGWKNIEELAEILKELHGSGLNAMEDPAGMSNAQWVELQSLVGELALIPDVPMRPAWEALEKDLEGMGRIYNIHPACMGSIRDAVKLGKKIKDMGAGLMIGDSSLTGPSCTAWQQVAIGTGAKWVEAIEKYDDSEGYFTCIEGSATYREKNGYYACKPKPGFGLELNEGRLKEVCPHHLEI